MNSLKSKGTKDKSTSGSGDKAAFEHTKEKKHWKSRLLVVPQYRGEDER